MNISCHVSRNSNLFCLQVSNGEGCIVETLWLKSIHQECLRHHIHCKLVRVKVVKAPLPSNNDLIGCSYTPYTPRHTKCRTDPSIPLFNFLFAWVWALYLACPTLGPLATCGLRGLFCGPQGCIRIIVKMARGEWEKNNWSAESACLGLRKWLQFRNIKSTYGSKKIERFKRNEHTCCFVFTFQWIYWCPEII